MIVNVCTGASRLGLRLSSCELAPLAEPRFVQWKFVKGGWQSVGGLGGFPCSRISHQQVHEYQNWVHIVTTSRTKRWCLIQVDKTRQWLHHVHDDWEKYLSKLCRICGAQGERACQYNTGCSKCLSSEQLSKCLRLSKCTSAIFQLSVQMEWRGRYPHGRGIPEVLNLQWRQSSMSQATRTPALWLQMFVDVPRNRLNRPYVCICLGPQYDSKSSTLRKQMKLSTLQIFVCTAEKCGKSGGH